MTCYTTRMSYQFELDGTPFQLKRLGVKASLKGLKMVSGTLLPAIADAVGAEEGSLGGAVARVVEGLDCLPELLDLFTPAATFTRAEGQTVELKPFLEDVFGGRPDVTVAFLVACVRNEYGRFLAAEGRRLLKQATGIDFDFPTILSGISGASSVNNESQTDSQ